MAGRTSAERWSAGLRIIREDIRCSAVKITGRGLRRVSLAAREATDQGLQVWFNPAP